MAANLERKTTHRGRFRPMSEINVTPLVDVMLVLLVVFMITAPLLTVGVTVELPESEAPPLPGQDEPLTVSIDASGAVYIQETQVALEELGAKLHAVTGEKPDTRIFVRGDRHIDYGQVMAVMGAVRAAGFPRVALVTEPTLVGAKEN